MPRVIAVANQKAGVGKTTSVIALMREIAALDRQVLAVDLDPQARLTAQLGIDPDSLDESIHAVLLGESAAFPAMIDTDARADLLPATLDLAAVEAKLMSRPGRENVLRDALAPVIADYDYVLIDCAPTLGVITLNALTAAHEVVIPVHVNAISARGLTQLLETIAEVREFTNPQLQARGLLPTFVPAENAAGLVWLGEFARATQTTLLEQIQLASAPTQADGYRRLAAEIVGR